MISPLIVSTDFDGTLAHEDSSQPFAPVFFDWLETERKKREVIWVINTGRSADNLREELLARRTAQWPQWVAVIEREIYRCQDQRFLPHEAWNKECANTHQQLFATAKPVIHAILNSLKDQTGLQTIEDFGFPGFICGTEEQADEVCHIFHHLEGRNPELTIVRNRVFIRFAHQDFNKGSCLEEITKQEGLSSAHCFAAGDHLNDLPMLQTCYAQYLACPSNSVKEVRDLVFHQGGFIATQPVELGVVEGLNHYFRK